MEAGTRLIGGVFVVAGVGAATLLWPAWQNREAAGSRSFAVVAVGVAGYVLASGLDLLTTSYAVSLALQKVVNACGVLIGVAWLSLAVEVSDRVRLSRRLVAGVGCLLLVGWAVNWVNPGELVLTRGAGLVGAQFQVEGGPGFWFLLSSAWVNVLGGTALLVADYAEATGLRRRQTGLLALAILPALVASVLNGVLLATTEISYDYTVFGWLLSLAAFAVALYSGRFLDVSAVARRRVFEETADPIVTLDTAGRVVDSNPAARSLVGVDDDWGGMPAAEFFAPLPVEAARLWSGERLDTELSFDHRGRRRHFTLTTVSVAGPQGGDGGYLVSLVDITSLKERERTLDLMRQVQSRVLRHNIRHDMQIIKPAVDAAAETVEDERRRLVERAVDRSESLLSVSEKARAVEQLAERDHTATRFDLRETLSALVADGREQFPAVSFELDATGDCTVETVPAIRLAFENVLENAAEHNDADAPEVCVTLTGGPEAVTVVVRDNGPGIPDHEIAVLEEGEETPLEHGTGIGLWVVQWVVDGSAVEVDYEASDDGTEITVMVPRVS